MLEFQSPPVRPPEDRIHRRDFHFHEVKPGLVVRCYHKCRGLLMQWQFWAGMTLGFPVEHFIWMHVYPLSIVGHWIMGNG
jgi:hypothetical protein